MEKDTLYLAIAPADDTSEVIHKAGILWRDCPTGGAAILSAVVNDDTIMSHQKKRLGSPIIGINHTAMKQNDSFISCVSNRIVEGTAIYFGMLSF